MASSIKGNSMNNANTQGYSAFFLKHQRAIVLALIFGWFSLNVLVLATNVIMEAQRTGKTLAFWEPFCWEISSAIMIIVLIPIGTTFSDRLLSSLKLNYFLIAHLIATIPFSILHVSGMVGIRKIWYHFLGNHYSFGNISAELFYEYRKDAQTYLTLALIIFAYRLLVRRLQGEASYLTTENAAAPSELKPERLLIKKLNREYLIQTKDIEWIEASGNYANLHIHKSIYPMRITMDKLEELLPSQFIRVHRSTIVNLEQIQNIQAQDSGDYQIKLHSGILLALSRRLINTTCQQSKIIGIKP
jgi:hypothetical protein